MVKVPYPKNQYEVHHKKGNTADIIEVVMAVANEPHSNMKAFANEYVPTRKGLRKLHDDMAEWLFYVEDRREQLVKYPANLWHTRTGDCKSYTVFIVAVLKNMGVPCVVRFVSYDNGPVTHVYPVAILDGRDIILDVVLTQVTRRDQFDREKRYKYKMDYSV